MTSRATECEASSGVGDRNDAIVFVGGGIASVGRVGVVMVRGTGRGGQRILDKGQGRSHVRIVVVMIWL